MNTIEDADTPYPDAAHLAQLAGVRRNGNLAKPSAIQLDQILSSNWVRPRSCQGEGEKYRYGLDDRERRGYGETCLGVMTPADADGRQQGEKKLETQPPPSAQKQRNCGDAVS